MLFRSRTDGPAILILEDFIEIEKDNKVSKWKWSNWSGKWYIHGVEIPNGKIVRWAKENHVPMWNEPCYDQSAFRDAAGEVAFLTSIATEFEGDPL